MFKSKADKRTLRYRCVQPTESLLHGKSFRWIENGGKVLGVAHCDSVHCGKPTVFKNRGRYVRSTTLDDRLGVHILLDVLPQMGITTDVLLTDDEEIGQSTASDFAETIGTDHPYNWIFSFDRKGSGSVVYDFTTMEPYAKHYFKKVHRGSFSDISYLESLHVGAVNIGAGYHNEHTLNSFADLRETQKQVNRFANFYREQRETMIEHTPIETQWDSETDFVYRGSRYIWSSYSRDWIPEDEHEEYANLILGAESPIDEEEVDRLTALNDPDEMDLEQEIWDASRLRQMIERDESLRLMDRF